MSRGIHLDDWIMLVASVIILTVVFAAWTSFSMFLVAINADLGWSHTALSGVFSVFIIVQALVVPFAGTLADRFSPQLVIRVATVFAAMGLAASSRATEVWQLYLTLGLVVGVSVAAAGFTPIMAAAGRRFAKRNMGLVMGIIAIGTGLPVATMVPMCQYFIQTFDWRTAYLLLAAIVFIIAETFTWFLGNKSTDTKEIESDPLEQKEVSPTTQEKIKGSSTTANEWTLATALRTRRFWFASATFFAYNLGNQLVLLHQVPYLVDLGLTAMVAATVVSIGGWTALPSKIMWGIASDRFGREIVFTAGSVLTAIAMSLLILLESASNIAWLPYLFGLLYGAGWAVCAPMQSAITADLFPGKNYGSIWGGVYLFILLASAGGISLGGYLFDTTESYHTAFYISVAFVLISAVLVWATAPHKAHITKTVASRF